MVRKCSKDYNNCNPYYTFLPHSHKGIKEILKYLGVYGYTSMEVSVRVNSYTCTIDSHYTVSACLNMLICCQIFSIVTMAEHSETLTCTDFSGHISIVIPKPESAWLLKVLTMLMSTVGVIVFTNSKLSHYTLAGFV